jgi:ribosomal protein L23
MSTFRLIESEKSFLIQQNNFFYISFDDKNFQPNKIEVQKLLKLHGYNPIEIKVINQYEKKKRRGKGGKTISQKRHKKYYVKLKVGEKIENKQESSI